MSFATNAIFSDEEKDILQEIMNIAFGSATADLAEVIDIFVELSVPQIHLIHIGELPDFLKNTIQAYDETVIVDQKFWGDFNGSGLLVLPARATKEMLMILGDKESEVALTETMATLEKEALVEIGNILIGACVGKISELLDTFATYSPPRIINGSNDQNSFIKSFDPLQIAIVLKTIFKFEHKDLSGLLLLLANQEAIGWLRKALHEFLESYE